MLHVRPQVRLWHPLLVTITKHSIALVLLSTCIIDEKYMKTGTHNMYTAPYSRKTWWRIKFGGLAVCLCNCQI